MTTEVELGHHPSYLCVTVRGPLDLKGGHQVIKQIVDTHAGESFPILLDVRRAACRLSRADILVLVDDICDHWAAFLQWVVVLYCRNSKENTTDFLELCAGNRGFRIRAFSDAELAQRWLDQADQGLSS